MLRKFAWWMLIAVSFLALAGFIGVLVLQHEATELKKRQRNECIATINLHGAMVDILSAIAEDPNTSQNVKTVIIQNEPRLTKSLLAAHHCRGG